MTLKDSPAQCEGLLTLVGSLPDSLKQRALWRVVGRCSPATLSSRSLGAAFSIPEVWLGFLLLRPSHFCPKELIWLPSVTTCLT